MVFTNRPKWDKRSCTVIDFDGVIYNLMASVEMAVYNLNGTRFRRENILTYDFNKSLDPTLVDETMLDPVKAMGISREFIFSLMGNPNIYNYNCYYNGFKPAIKSLATYIPVVIYSYCLSDSMASAKAVLFEDLFKNCDNVYYCTSSNGDMGFKAAYPNAKFVIEDSLSNLDEYLKEEKTFAKGRPRLYLVDHTYNQEKYNADYSFVFEHCRRVPNVVEAVTRIVYQNYTNLSIGVEPTSIRGV